LKSYGGEKKWVVKHEKMENKENNEISKTLNRLFSFKTLLLEGEPDPSHKLRLSDSL
jgi:hypothetical protein